MRTVYSMKKFCMGFEGSIQTSVLDFLNSLPGCVAENVSGNSQQSGRPDINGCYKGRMFKIELKTPDNKNKASKKQGLHLRRWRRSGAITGVVYSLRFIKEIFSDEGFPTPGHYKLMELNGCESWINIPEV